MLHTEPLRWWIVKQYPDVEMKERAALTGKGFYVRSKTGGFAVIRDTEHEALVWVFKAHCGVYGEVNNVTPPPCPVVDTEQTDKAKNLTAKAASVLAWLLYVLGGAMLCYHTSWWVTVAVFILLFAVLSGVFAASLKNK
jgi:hypothetical protein